MKIAACALAAWSMWFWRPKADKEMMAFLSAMGRVHEFRKHDPVRAFGVGPGEFVVVKGPYDLWTWYRSHGFQKMPFYWNGRQIFRREGSAA